MVKLKQPNPKKKIPAPGGSGPSKPPTPKSPDTKAGKTPSVGGGVASPTATPTPGPKFSPEKGKPVVDAIRDLGADVPPTISLADKRAMRELLARPTEEGLRWLVDPEAQRVLRVANDMPGILDAAIQATRTLTEAFDFLFADPLQLSEEDILDILKLSPSWKARGRQSSAGPRGGISSQQQEMLPDVSISFAENTVGYDDHDCALPMIASRMPGGCNWFDVTITPDMTLVVLAISPFNPLVVRVRDPLGREFWVDASVDLDLVEGDITTIDVARDLIPDPSLNPWTRAEVERRSTTYPLDVEDPGATAVMRFGVIQPQYSGVWAEGRHPGMDFFAPAGTRVVSLTDGEVVGVFTPSMFESRYQLSPYTPELGRNFGLAGIQGYDPRTDADSLPAMDRVGGLMGQAESLHGAFVVVRTGNAFVVYAHLNPSSIQVGQYVQEGQIIGEVGTYDERDPDNDHVHIELRVAGSYSNRRLVSPQTALNPELLFEMSLLDSFLSAALMLSRSQELNAEVDETVAGLQPGAAGQIYHVNQGNVPEYLWPPTTGE